MSDANIKLVQDVYAAFGQALAMIGSWLLLPVWLLAPLWCVGAILAILRSMRTEHVMPGLQGALYVIAAAWVSGLLDYARHALTGAFPSAPPDSVIGAAIGAVICYGLWARTAPGDWCRAARVPVAALAAFAVTALLIAVVVALFSPQPSTVGAIRTLVICLGSLALGYAGSHWDRRELVIVAYAAIALGSLKVLLEDLRHGTPAAFAVSLLCYGAVLILVPRMVKRAG